MINWTSFLLYLTSLFLFLLCLFFLFLRKQILFLWAIAIIFFIWLNIFRNKRWSWMNLYLSKSSFLIIRSIINDMIILLLMLPIVIIWWSWLDFLKSWCGVTAVIFWICSYDRLLIFIGIAVVFFLLELDRLAFVCLVLIYLLDWKNLWLDLSRFSLILYQWWARRIIFFRFIMLFSLSHL